LECAAIHDVLRVCDAIDDDLNCRGKSDLKRIVSMHRLIQRTTGVSEDRIEYELSLVKHYALTDQKEFFAEMTEAFFGSNDFYPFNRAELKQLDPSFNRLLEEIWNE